MISRQRQRALKREAAKFERKEEYLREHPRRQNPLRKSLLHGLAEAYEKFLSPVYVGDKSEAMNTIRELGNEFLSRSRGKNGKKPHGKAYIKSVAFARNRTNPVGHFA